MTIADMASGTRFTTKRCRLIQLNHYYRRILDKETLIWRHVFRTADRETLVYSGEKNVASGYQTWYDITATVKRQEPEYHSTRIMRPVVTMSDLRQEDLI